MKEPQKVVGRGELENGGDKEEDKLDIKFDENGWKPF